VPMKLDFSQLKVSNEYYNITSWY